MLRDNGWGRRVEEGLDFMIRHVNDSRPTWPRLVATRGRWNQLVFNKQEALARYKAADYLDCRTIAYFDYDEYLKSHLEGRKYNITVTEPSVSQSDLDREHFPSDEELESAVDRTYKNFKERLDAQPTVIWTGNGYHVVNPQFAFVLDSPKGPKVFREFEQPSRKLLQFQEQSMTDGLADKEHSKAISFNNCWLRIPGSLNSTQVDLNERGEIVNIPTRAEVRIVRRWNGNRQSVEPIMPQYYIWLVSEDDKRKDRQIGSERTRCYYSRKNKDKDKNKNKNKNTIDWIENLLGTSLSDGRKFCVKRILAQYFLNIRGFSRSEAFDAIYTWLGDSNLISKLLFKPTREIDMALNYTQTKSYPPLGRKRLKEEFPKLYSLLENEGVVY